MAENVQNPPVEPLAVIGMSCRFAPDLDTPGRLWEFLRAGGSAVGEMPDRRWDPYVTDSRTRDILRTTTRKGSFMRDIEGFDAEFFQITPREAEYIDPQQRIMLELAWEALCDAGLPPTSLAGTDASVYVAANSNDYGRRLLEDLDRTGAWAVNGTTFYGIANRISYFLDAHGPSMAVDTACAGSLTALHVAGQALHRGETSVAIVGGINIMASPALVVALDAASATSPDGRSKSFDKAADGYGRGEGGGVVVLKRLSDAVRDGDPVHGLVLASGVFQDGRSDGMMAPNGSAQQRMLEEIYRRSGIDPGTVQYVEAHGTGTQLGDAAEAQAIGNVFGPGRDGDNPLLIGTLKPNVGHVEAASGIAGVIKVLLGMRHGELPPSPHEEPDPGLGLEARGLRLVAEPTPWPRGEHGMRAGVSSYGVGGSIAHAVLQQAPPRPDRTERPAAAATGRPQVFPLSAASEQGVRGLAGSVAAWLRAHPETALDDLAHTFTARRSHLSRRAAVVAGTTEELLGGLDALAGGEKSPAVALASASGFGDGGAAGPAWVFSGHGAQWSGMGRELLTTEPVFAQVIDELAPVFSEELGWTPREAIEAGGPWTVVRTQAMTFAMQVALAEVWSDLGLRPGAIIGHSVGEIAAAAVAGSLDRAEAARFACRRARALGKIAGRGAMAMVPMAFADVEQRVAGRDAVVAAIAASPLSTVVSGDTAAVEALLADLEADGIQARRVNTDVAFHSPHVQEILDEVRQAAAALRAGTPRVTLYSTALADPRSDAPREGEYWATNLADPVRFHQAVRAALDDGTRVFLEVSSHPVVAHSITETALDAGVPDAHVAITLRREQPEQRTVLANLARLHSLGTPVTWSYDGDLVDVPAVRWQHKPYWIFPDTAPEQGAGLGHDPQTHTLIGARTTVASAPVQRVWQTELHMENRPYAQSHKVVGVETVPASVVLNSFITAATNEGERACGLRDIVFRIPLAAHPTRVVQVVLEQDKVRIASRIKRDQESGGVRDDEWLTHTTATVVHEPEVGARPMEDPDVIRARCPVSWTWAKVDGIFRTMGVDGYTFPWVVEELLRGEDEQFSTITVDHTPKLHPSSWTAVVDAALTASGVLVMDENSNVLRTCSHLESLSFVGPPPPRIHVHTVRDPRTPDTISMTVADESGAVVCEARGLRYVKVQDIGSGAVGPRDLVHELAWEPVEVPADAPVPSQALVVGGAAGGPALVEALTARGVRARAVPDATAIGDASLTCADVVVVAPEALLPGEAPEQAARRCAQLLVDAVQQVAAVPDERRRPRVWALTREVRAGATEAALAHAPLWGAGRIVAGERPDLWGGVIDVAENAVPQQVASLIGALPHTEDVLSLDSEGVTAARLRQVARPAEREPVDCRPDGTYLVTGGLGALGLEAARHLVEQGARRLVLIGRRGLPSRSRWDQVDDPAVAAQIAEVVALEAAGATVRVLSLDISDAEATARALDPGALDMPPVRGIVHCAGVVSDALVEKTGAANLDTTMGPKADGAMVLHRLFPAGTLDFFTMFSSCGQLARLTGQVSYASANSFLDALAALRRSRGETGTTSFAWAQWIGRGMGETTGRATILEAESRGLGGITVSEALRSWAYADRFALPYAAVMRVMPDHTLPVFSHLSVTDAGAQSADAGGVDWATVPAGELPELVLKVTHEQVAAELNLAVDDIAIDQPLLELGVDSVLTVALRVRLHRCFAVDLPPTILWSNPTVRALAEFLAAEVGGATADAEETDPVAGLPAPQQGSGTAEQLDAVAAAAG
uniref:5-methyl-1-naphthoate synthase n=1 Tax=Streptomyces sahachiroi TaxID=285525 RepID=AZIB_STREG|nr:RecName: Full=5-methyl-1-naphthoate synthase; AltName: Full=Azinomycin biosynthesis protein B [Streptomyces sahachiroi]ABY83164.1 Azi26 [Streptomyces sahachiroi]BFD88289.1 phthiocerol type I polyketide synthase PpsA [Streptomyces sp. Xyl84]